MCKEEMLVYTYSIIIAYIIRFWNISQRKAQLIFQGVAYELILTLQKECKN